MTINLSWRLVAVGLILVLLGGAIAAFPAASQVCFFLSGIAILFAVIVWAKGMRDDRYSLSALQRVHEKAEVADLELEAPPDDMVYCVCCGGAYPAEFPTCPGCATKRQ